MGASEIVAWLLVALFALLFVRERREAWKVRTRIEELNKMLDRVLDAATTLEKARNGE